MVIPPPNTSVPTDTRSDASLKAAARELEATFLAQMLTAAGMGKTSNAFGGGAGEDQFASFLVQEHARKIVETGGIGLAESLFEALKERNT